MNWRFSKGQLSAIVSDQPRLDWISREKAELHGKQMQAALKKSRMIAMVTSKMSISLESCSATFVQFLGPKH